MPSPTTFMLHYTPRSTDKRRLTAIFSHPNQNDLLSLDKDIQDRLMSMSRANDLVVEPRRIGRPSQVLVTIGKKAPERQSINRRQFRALQRQHRGKDISVTPLSLQPPLKRLIDDDGSVTYVDRSVMRPSNAFRCIVAVNYNVSLQQRRTIESSLTPNNPSN